MACWQRETVVLASDFHGTGNLLAAEMNLPLGRESAVAVALLAGDSPEAGVPVGDGDNSPQLLVPRSQVASVEARGDAEEQRCC